MSKPVKESRTHHQAKLYYLSLGEDRSHKKVATKFGVSVTSINNWASKFGWKLYVREQEVVISGMLENITIQNLAEFKANSQKIILAWTAKFLRNMKNGLVDATSFSNFLSGIKIYMQLSGDDAFSGDSETRIMAIVNRYEGMTLPQFEHEVDGIYKELDEIVELIKGKDKT